MPQLLFHGKKTVPAALRRDVWRPYFSVHFPANDAGMKTGLTVYRQLLELAQRRQLSPPPESLMTTQRDIDAMVFNAGTPLRALDKYLHGRSRINLKPPVLGSKLPLAMRARKLMNQKATSVADLAFVLGVARDTLEKLYERRYNAAEELAKADKKYLARKGRGARKRLRAVRADEEAEDLQTSLLMVKASHVAKGEVGLDKHVAQRMSMEFDGVIGGEKGRLTISDLSELPTSAGQNYDLPAEVEILWADLRDGSFAKEWPEHVYHAGMQPLAFTRKASSIETHPGAVDEDGTYISAQRQRKVILGSSSQHVHGRAKLLEYNTFREEENSKNNQIREQRRMEAENQDEYNTRERILLLYSNYQKHAAQLETIEAIREKRESGDELTAPEQDLLAREHKIMGLEQKAVTAFRDAEEDDYSAASWAREAFFFDETVKKVAQLESGVPASLAGRSEQRMSEADPATGVAPIERPNQLELDDVQGRESVRFGAAEEFLAASPSLHPSGRRTLRYDLIDRIMRPATPPAMVEDRSKSVLGRVRGMFGRKKE
jgi:hypothetical protein